MKYKITTTVNDAMCMLVIEYNCVLECESADLADEQNKKHPCKMENILSKYLHVFYDAMEGNIKIVIDKNPYYDSVSIVSQYLWDFDKQQPDNLTIENFCIFVKHHYAHYLSTKKQLSFDGISYSYTKME